ncbi:MAG: sensor histidine kinase [Pseudomonadota bacterium]
MVKMKIGKKLLLTYAILLVAVLLVTGVTFRIMIRSYLVSEARTVLKAEAKAIADTLEKIPIFDGAIRPNLLARREMKIHGQFIDSKVIILNNDRKIIYSNLEEADRKAFRSMTGKNLKARGYVSEQMPIMAKNGEVKGQVLLFTKVEDLDKISAVMNRTQFMSLVMGGVVAIILGLVFQSGLTRPIKQLGSYISGFSLKDMGPGPDIRTGDEIEELSGRFEEMAQKLKAYDTQQKQFLQNSSHELKTPLMSIQGYAEAIRDGIVEGDELQESLGIIIDESKRLKKLVDELIFLAKLDNVEEAFQFEKEDVKTIIEQSVKKVKALSDSKGLRVEIRGKSPCTGRFDREKLVGALINILGNCIRYAVKEITVECGNKGSDIEIWIKDDGPGFKDGEEKMVFERFYRGDNGGTGIGLSIAKAVVEGHKGRIEAFNSAEGGAAFRLLLPIF